MYCIHIVVASTDTIDRVWPISNVISWTFVPPPLRSLWNNLVSFALVYYNASVAASKRVAARKKQ